MLLLKFFTELGPVNYIRTWLTSFFAKAVNLQRRDVNKLLNRMLQVG